MSHNFDVGDFLIAIPSNGVSTPAPTSELPLVQSCR
jgi:hypothetical protein